MLKSKLIPWLIYSFVIVTPLLYYKDSKSVFSMPKLTAVRLISLALVIILAWNIVKEKKVSFIKNRFNILLLVYAGISLITTVLSHQIYASVYGSQGRFMGIITLLNFLLIAFLSFQLLTKAQIRKMSQISVIVATMLAIWGIFQHFGLFVGKYWTNNPLERAFATIEHGNHYGAYLVFNLIILFSFILEKIQKFSKEPPLKETTFNRKKIIWLGLALILAILYLTAIIFTASRAALLTLILSVVIFIFLLFQKFHPSPKFFKKIALIGAISVAMIGISFIFSDTISNKITQTTLVQRTKETITFIRQGNYPDRVSWFLSSLAMAKDNPIFGQGLSTFKDRYNLYRRLDYRNQHESQYSITPEAAHNEYVNKLAEQGIAGLFSYLAIILFVLTAGWKSIKKDDPDNILKIGLLAAVLSYLIQVGFSFGVITTLTIFYVFLGALLKMSLDENDSGQKSEKQHARENSALKIIHISNFSRGLIVASIIITALFFFNFTKKQALAEIYYRQAEIAFRENNLEAAIYFADKMINAQPREYDYFTFYGDSLYPIAAQEKNTTQALVLMENAVIAYEKAAKLSPEMPFIHINFGLIYLLYSDIWAQSGDSSKAGTYMQRSLEEYEKAIKYAPNNPLFTYTYGDMLLQTKQLEKAIIQFENTLKIREDYSDTAYQLATLYFETGQYEKAQQLLLYEDKQGRGNYINNQLYNEVIKKL